MQASSKRREEGVCLGQNRTGDRKERGAFQEQGIFGEESVGATEW